MAIIKIPSKHIYEMQNEKVIDNDIDRIEVSAKSVSIVNDSGNVYNTKVMDGFYSGSKQNDLQGDTGNYVRGNNIHYLQALIAYIEETPIYVTKTITIPKDSINTRTLSILTGKDENDQPNIKYSLYGNIKTTTATSTATATLPDTKWETLDKTTYALKSDVSLGTINEGEPTTISLTDDIINSTHTYTQYVEGGSAGGGNPYKTVTVGITLNNKEDVLTASVNETSTNFTITLTILCGLKIVKLEGTQSVLSSSVPAYGSFDIPLSGNYTEYSPTQVNISFYGNTIGIDLTDNTITLGEGKNVISFQSNELIQTTNRPTIESQYQAVLDEWKDGKETATLRCGIADYYDTDGNKVISLPSIQPVQISIGTELYNNNYEIHHKGDLNIGDTLSYKGETTTYKFDGDYYYITIEPDGAFASMIGKGYFTVNVINQLPMSFQIGDIVQPYVFGSNGKDRPMSVNKNGTPKNFKVLSKGISDNGAVLQTITCQEHKNT